MKKHMINDQVGHYTVSKPEQILGLAPTSTPEEKLLRAIFDGAMADGIAAHVISATEASRAFSTILSKVHYQGESFQIKRGREIIAQITPVSRIPHTMKITELNAFFEHLPTLSAEDCQAFADTLREIRTEMPTEKTAWD